MWIVNENPATSEIVLRRREVEEDEDREPNDTDPVAEEVRVEFLETGRAQVRQEVGKRLIEDYGSIREAEGPDDVAAFFEEQRAEEEEADEESEEAAEPEEA